MSNLIGNMARSVGLPTLKRAAGVVTKLLPIPQPLLMVGPQASLRLARAIGDFAHRSLLVVSDPTLAGLGLLQPLVDALAAGGARVHVFDQVTPDAPIPDIEQGLALFRAHDCDAIVAFGGGSVMDAAKVIGLAAANGKHPRELVGYFRGLHAPVPIYAVPTTAGTGSEVTVAAVVSDPAHRRKLVIADTRLVPRMAALDPCLMTGLPPAITAATGMDALTHAVEAYLGHWATEFTDRMALAAVGMIYRHLPRACADGHDLEAREQMALASTYAGLAFTRANVGNVHAIAHQLGGRYHTPHGMANALLLAPVLRFYGDAVHERLAPLAVRAGLGRDDEPAAVLAQRFVESIEAMNAALGLPRRLDALLDKDIPALARAACWEADTNYPVPKPMSRDDCEALLRELLPADPPAPAGRAAARKTPAAKTVAPKTAAPKTAALMPAVPRAAGARKSASGTPPRQPPSTTPSKTPPRRRRAAA